MISQSLNHFYKVNRIEKSFKVAGSGHWHTDPDRSMTAPPTANDFMKMAQTWWNHCRAQFKAILSCSEILILKMTVSRPLCKKISNFFNGTTGCPNLMHLVWIRVELGILNLFLHGPYQVYPSLVVTELLQRWYDFTYNEHIENIILSFIILTEVILKVYL